MNPNVIRTIGVWIAATLLAAASGAHAQRVCHGVAPVQHSDLQQVLIAEGFNRPLLALSPPGDATRLFIVEQVGTIRVWQRGAATTEHSLFLNLTDRVSTLGNEMGLLGMAFDPGFAANGEFYLSYTTFVDGIIRSTIGRFNLDPADPTIGDPASEVEILTLQQPGQTNHNGGHIEFDADGYLYMSLGDGGGSNDNHGMCGNGQDAGNLLGTIIRIDPRGETGGGPECAESGSYTIPPDNPLADGVGSACDEIWAYGLRNPWRFAIDPASSDLYIADVGQNCWEEVNYVPASAGGGQNYGWRPMEGNHCFNPASPFNCNPPAESCATSPACNDPGLTDPVLEFDHSTGCSITGGYVYRGCRMPALEGTYFYGDYCAGFVRSLRIAGGAVTEVQIWPLLGVPFGLSSFGRDAEGELYVLDHINDQVFKILPLLSDVEVSGTGAADSLLLDKPGPWTWEDLTFQTGQPVEQYRVYRQVGAAAAFEVVHATDVPSWPDGGDPTAPAAGELYSYLVTAVQGDEESLSGHPDVELQAARFPTTGR